MSEAVFPLVPLMREGLAPIAELGRVRAEQPVVQIQIPGGPSAWLVTRYDDVRTVLADGDRFSNDLGNLAAVGAGDMFPQWKPGGLGFRDPPEHTRLRRMMAPEFTGRRLQRLESRIEAIVTQHLDAMEDAGSPADLVKGFASPIPSLVVCELLGVPEDERADFQDISNSRFNFSGDAETSVAAIEHSLSFVLSLIARQRKEPGEGLLGMLIREYGDEMTDRDLAGLADGLLTGGHDTTVSMIALGTLLLLQNPEHVALVRERDDHIGAVVEELLRLITVVQVAFPRFAREDIVLSGQHIAAGELVLCSLSSANRDEALGAEIAAFDPARAASSHVAFGHGMHHCIGAPLARMEMRIAYPALLRRFPNLRVTVAPEDIPYRSFSIVYGVESLPVAW